jgi:hypothetical protein
MVGGGDVGIRRGNREGAESEGEKRGGRVGGGEARGLSRRDKIKGMEGWGGGCLSRVIKLLYAPERPKQGD